MDIRKRLTALLNMANDSGASMNEKIQAYEKAQKLMLEHGLTEKDTAKEDYTETMFKFASTGGKIWQHWIAIIIAEANGVFVVKSRKGLIVYGKPTDISVFEELSQFVIACVINRGLYEYAPVAHKYNKKSFMTSFGNGAYLGYKAKVNELKAHPGYGIVLSKTRAARNDFAITKNQQIVTTRRTTPNHVAEAKSKGFQYGKTLNDKAIAGPKVNLNRNLLG